MSGAYPKQALAALFLAAALTACSPRPVRELPAPSAPSAPESSVEPGVAREGRAFRVVAEDSLLTLLIYRGGALAKAGHNHVIASRAMSGMAWLPDDATRASFEVRVPVLDFTIDEPELRALEGPDFASAVPDTAREGTRKNMLSESMLDAGHYPEIVLRSAAIQSATEGLLAQVSVTLRDQTRTIPVPLQYELDGDRLDVRGELRLRQTELGLTPFSLLGGALRVEDEMTVKFLVVALPAE